MIERRLGLALEFRDNTLGQDFAEFYPPLIERVDLPDGSLRENDVLVKCYKLAENFRRQPLGKDCI